MKHLTWFCIRHGLLPRNRLMREVLLRSIFKPASTRDTGLSGWYDLGPDARPQDVERFKAWLENE